MVAIAKDMDYLCNKKGECDRSHCSNCSSSSYIDGWKRFVTVALYWIIIAMCVGTIIRGVAGEMNYLLIKACAASQDYHAVDITNLDIQVLGGSFYKVKDNVVIVKYIKPTGKGNYLEHVTGAFDTKNWRYQVLYGGHLSDKLWHTPTVKNERERLILNLLDNPESRLLYKKVKK